MSWIPVTTPNFSRKEMACKCGKCGSSCEMDQKFMNSLQELRDIVGPLKVNSGYRCPLHPIEAAKASPGAHSTGKAADIRMLDGEVRYMILANALDCGFVGIGNYPNYIHLDTGHPSRGRPYSWVGK